MIKQIWILFCHLFGFFLLMQSFSPYPSSSSSSGKRTNFQITNQSCFDYREETDRHIIFILIDALRSDYIFNKNSSYRLKIIDKLEEENLLYSIPIKVHSPTVTLPRIKSILTGTIPSFWDVLFNYNSSELEIDNLLFQYKRQYPKRKIAFYGDDTWLKLFPNRIFDRFQGVQSFFVNDYHEIDLNVTKNLEIELNRMNEWNLLILHYLGLDHIGHSHGAFHKLIQEKLFEFDQIIKKISEKLNQNDLLIITGDHGMIDQGGHGGTSDQELFVPFILVSPSLKFNENQTKIQTNETFYQIDLTPTLSSLMEIGIPWNNLGISIKNLFDNFYSNSEENLCQCLMDDNQRQINRLFFQRNSFSNSQENLRLARDEFLFSFNEQNLNLMFISFLLFISSTIISWISIKQFQFLTKENLLLIFFFNFLFYLINENHLIHFSMIMIILNLLLIFIGEKPNLSMNSFQNQSLSNQFLTHYSYIYYISLFSTSFIEEEHQCWYLFISTYICLKCFEEKSKKYFFILILLRLIRSWNQTGNKWLNQSDLADFFNDEKNEIYLFILHLMILIYFSYLLIQRSNKRFHLIVLPILLFIYRWNLFNENWFHEFLPLCYYLIIVFLYLMNYLSMKDLILCLLMMICRVHQSLIIIIHYFFQQIIHVQNASLAFLFSQTVFFHLGNSNSFVTIDISTGFVGLFFYNPLIHGILIYLSIYGLSIQWLTNLTIDQRKNSLKQMTIINCFFVLSIIVQRSHLFLWTVFIPKLFYLFAQTFSFLFLFIRLDNQQS